MWKEALGRLREREQAFDRFVLLTQKPVLAQKLMPRQKLVLRQAPVLPGLVRRPQ